MTDETQRMVGTQDAGNVRLRFQGLATTLGRDYLQRPRVGTTSGLATTLGRDYLRARRVGTTYVATEWTDLVTRGVAKGIVDPLGRDGRMHCDWA